MGESSISDVIYDVCVKKSSTPPSPRNDTPGSCHQCQQASDRPVQLQRHLEVKVVPPGTMPRETGVTVEWCTECVRKGYTLHRCCDDVPGISRGPHQQASS